MTPIIGDDPITRKREYVTFECPDSSSLIRADGIHLTRSAVPIGIDVRVEVGELPRRHRPATSVLLDEPIARLAVQHTAALCLPLKVPFEQSSRDQAHTTISPRL
jgi:hypothetical protein